MMSLNVVKKVADRKAMTQYELITICFQSIAIIIAGSWAIYTFYFEKIKAPKTAPVNISIKVDLKKLEIDKDGSEEAKLLLPVEMTISGKNPSKRTIYFLPNAWVAYGRKIQPILGNYTAYHSVAERVLNSGSTEVIGKSFRGLSQHLVSSGVLFTNQDLKPDEEISRTFVMFLPRDEYSSIGVTTVIPTVTAPNSGINVKWSLKHSDLQPRVDYSLVPYMSRTKRHWWKMWDRSEKVGRQLDKNAKKEYIDDSSELQVHDAYYVKSLLKEVAK